MRIAEDVAGHFLDQVGMRRLGCQQIDVAGKPVANGAEARYLKVEDFGAVDQGGARLHTVASIDGMVCKIGRQREAARHKASLPNTCKPISVRPGEHLKNLRCAKRYCYGLKLSRQV